jgi:hypothetical protein
MNAMSARKVELRETSGMVSVRIVATRQWLIAMLLDGAIFYAMYRYWQDLPYWWKVLSVVFLVFGLIGTLSELLGEEVVEFDSQKLTVRKELHGWERKREYDIAKCHELKWAPGHKGNSFMTCKVGWHAKADGLAGQLYYFAGRHTVKFGNRLSEDDALEILAALQRTMPEVAETLCATPAHKGHFIGLGLGRR